MLTLRSLVFNVLWYINLLGQMVLQTPWYFFLSHDPAQKVPRRWAHTTHWLHRLIVGTRIEILGAENIPQEGCVVACKHQSLWDFYAVNAMLDDPAFILKAELMKVPFFGWYVGYLGHIPIRRGDKGKAMRGMLKDAKERVKEGRQILIFPEGTRKAPGDDPDYRYGVTRMYLDLNCPVVPVALNSGLYWPRRKFMRHPGTIRAQFLEPILPGLDAKTFAAELERRIEETCDDLYVLAEQDSVRPPLTEKVKERIALAKARKKDAGAP